MRHPVRLGIVIVVYAASLPGMAASLKVFQQEMAANRPRLSILWAAAWLLHGGLSAAWVRGRRLHGFWSAAGLLAGLGSLLSAGVLFPIAVLLTAPAGILAVWLLLFQARFPPQPASASRR